MTFLEVWVGYTIVGSLIFAVMFLWAVRNRQFSQMDRARTLALNAEEPVEGAARPVSRIDRYTWVGIAIVSAALLAYTLWVAFRA